jgi:hypothetical protein
MKRLKFIVKEVVGKDMKVTTNKNGLRVEFKLKYSKA